MVTLVFAVTACWLRFRDGQGEQRLAGRLPHCDRGPPEDGCLLRARSHLGDARRFPSEAEGGLHSPGEGWGDPLATWAGWDPGDGNQVAVSFQDESGKIPLIHAEPGPTWTDDMFEYWQLPQDTSEHLADVLAGWMEKNHITTTALPDYDQATIPYAPPLRSMRSFSELAAIDFVKDTFFDKDGRPNQLWWRFYSDFSIFSFKQPNINGANADVLGGLGQFADTQQQAISDYLNGKGNYTTPSPLGKQWFSDGSQLAGVVGGVGDPQAFGTAITALRILITVTQGTARFDLSVVVAPSKGGASIVTTNATNIQQGDFRQ